MKNPIIPDTITQAAVNVLSPFCPNLTPERLLNALATKPETEAPERLLTRKEAAESLRISLPTLDRMLAAQELPRRKIRGAVRIPQSAIDSIIGGKTQNGY